MHLRKWVIGPALAIAASAAAAAGMVAPGPAALASSRPAAASSQVCGSDAGQSQHRYDHVIWIWMENHSYNTIVGSSAAPFANQLASECGLAANYQHHQSVRAPGHRVPHALLPLAIEGMGNPVPRGQAQDRRPWLP